MYKNKRIQIISLALSILIAGSMTGCPDPEKRADAVFQKNGLNRLRRANDFVKVGSVILVKDKKAIYADNMMDYINANPKPDVPVKEGESVISNTEQDTTMTAELAMKFLDSFLPIKAAGKIKFTSSVKIDQINAKTFRIKIPDLMKFLGDSSSNEFKERMAEMINDGYVVFLAYESYEAKTIKITSASGADISAGAEIGKTNPLMESAKPTLSWVKNSKTAIDINGATFYTFAVRTARLDYDKTKKMWAVALTDFAPVGVLGAGDDVKYSNSPLGASPTDFTTLDLIGN